MIGVAIGRSLMMGWSGSNGGKGCSPSLDDDPGSAAHAIDRAASTDTPLPEAPCDDWCEVTTAVMTPSQAEVLWRSSPVWWSVVGVASRARSCDPRERLRWCETTGGLREEPRSLLGGLGVAGLDWEVREGDPGDCVPAVSVVSSVGLLRGREAALEGDMALPVRVWDGVKLREPSPSELHRAFSSVTSCSSVRYPSSSLWGPEIERW